jgi:hypothetical protein
MQIQNRYCKRYRRDRDRNTGLIQIQDTNTGEKQILKHKRYYADTDTGQRQLLIKDGYR